MTDEVEKIFTPRGEARSMTSLKPNAVNVSYNNTGLGDGSSWFGASAPVGPLAPPQVAGRQFDFATGFNLNGVARPYEPLSFHALRQIADAYDPVRLIIERRKDQMGRLPWTIRVKHEGGKRPTAAQLPSQTRAKISEVTQFFKNPVSNMSFRTWQRALLEDLLVLDAPTLYCERDAGGNLVALALMDGSTIKPVIDDHGRIPRPFNWDGRPFNYNGTQVTVSNYLEVGCKIADGLLYVPAYQQILKGSVAVNYTTWDLIYRPLNVRTNSVFGRSPIEQIATTVSIAMRRSLAQLEYFREGNQPDAVYGLPETWGPDKIQQFQDYFDSLYSGNLANRRKMKFMPAGNKSSYVPLKEPPLKSEFDEWLVRIVCFAFSYPPSAFVSLSNRSIAESHARQADQEGIDPLKEWVADTINFIIEREFGDDIEFAWNEEQEIDPLKQKDTLVGYAESAVLTLNQVRAKLGEEPDPDPAADRLMVRTATGYVPIAGAPADRVEDAVNGVAKVQKKLHRVTMLPPANWKPRARFSLAGVTYVPDLIKNELPVFSEADVVLLECFGWSKK